MSRLPLADYRVGPTGHYLDRRSGTGKLHPAVDMYPTDVETFCVAPERCRVTVVRATPGEFDSYGPGAVRLESATELAELANLPGLGICRVWHTLAHLRPEDCARFAAGDVLEEGTPIGRVFVPQYQKTGWRHCHYEIWKSPTVPRGDARAPHTYHPERWAARRRALDAAFVAGGVAAVTALAGAVRA